MPGDFIPAGPYVSAVDAEVADAINDGTTTVAPSQNAVFDALALTVPTSRTLAGLDLSADRTASTLRTALSLVPGTDVQAYDADLGQIAAATFANDDFVQKKAGSLTNRTIAQVKADLGVVSPVHSQEPKYGASDTWGVPGDSYANFGSFSAAPNTLYPIPFVADSQITVTAIAAAQTAGGTAGNMRLLIYAADVDWQASGAPLLDTGSISTASNAVKSATGLSVVLAPGRYLRCFICDVAGLSYRVGAVSRTFLAPGIDGLATRWTGPVTYGAPSSPVWNGHLGNSTPTEMMIGMRWTV